MRDKKEVDNAVRIAIERIEYAVYVIITQDTASDTDGSTRVFHLNTEHNTLQQIQTLPTHHSAHVVMWYGFSSQNLLNVKIRVQVHI